MRAVLSIAAVVVLCASCAVGGLVTGIFSPGEWEEQGAQQARDDIEAGRPAIRSDELVLTRSVLVDNASGLPIEDWSVRCGTGYDWDRHEGLVEGYNVVIREALDAGRLDDQRVTDKVLDEADLRAHFEGADVIRFEADGDSYDTPDGRFRIELRQTRSDPGYRYVFVIRQEDGADRQMIHAFNPVELVLLPDRTTLLIRSEQIAISSWDLRSGRELQRIY